MTAQNLQLKVATSGGRPLLESLTVEPLGPDHYRLVHSPGLIEGLAAGDEFRVGPGETVSVTRHGGNFCVWFYFAQPGQNRGPDASRVEQVARRLGGYVDGGAYTSLVVNVPASTGFQNIVDAFDALSENIAGSTWMYGNAYDPEDGQTPLEWWQKLGR